MEEKQLNTAIKTETTPPSETVSLKELEGVARSSGNVTVKAQELVDLLTRCANAEKELEELRKK